MFLGLGIAAWIELVRGILAFPAAASALIKQLSKTPEEKHDALVAEVEKQAESFRKTGRPS